MENCGLTSPNKSISCFEIIIYFKADLFKDKSSTEDLKTVELFQNKTQYFFWV